MEDNKENVEMIKKFLENFVYSDVPYELDYLVFYSKETNKYVINLTVVIDVSKVFPSQNNFDKNYFYQASRIADRLDDLIKYLGIPSNMIQTSVSFDYVNDEIFDRETKLLKELVEQQISQITIDGNVEVFVDVRKSPEDYLYFELEIGTTNESTTLDYPTIMHIQDYVYNVIQETDMFPNLLSILTDTGEIVFWFND
jgi:hypothetical protein